MDAYSSGEEVVIKTRKPYTITKQRERWTEEEHNRFLEALKLYGRAWQRIEGNNLLVSETDIFPLVTSDAKSHLGLPEHIGTKTAVQIRSHAQKFFSKLEKEALVKGVPIGQALDIDIPPPRPKRKPSNPYPRKINVGTPISNNGGKDGKLSSISSSHSKQTLDLEKEPLPEKTNGDEGPTIKENKGDSCSKVFTILQEVPCSSVSSANKSSLSISVSQRNSYTLREFIPSVKEVLAHNKTDESIVTIELKENQKLEKDDGKHTEQNNGTSKASMLENSDASHVKLVQHEKTDDLNCALTKDGMQGNQNYPRHVPVHVLDGNLGTNTQTPTQDMLFRDSIFHPMGGVNGGVNGQPNVLTNSAASNTSENQSNTARSSIHQSFPAYPPFTPVRHNQDNYQSFLHASSTFSSLVVSTLMQNPAAHAAASFTATFSPYANADTSADSPACSQGGFPSRQIGSPPSMAAIAAATVAAATAWWAAHGLLPLCAPFHTAFTCPPATATAAPPMDTGEAQAAKTDKGESILQNPPTQDQILDPEFSEALQPQNSASKSPAASSDSEESGDVKLDTSSKATDHESNKVVSEHLDSNKTKGRKQVDRSSCGSNTASSSDAETDALEKEEKEKEEPKAPDPSHLAAEFSNRRCRSIGSITDSWKEVSEEGRLAFQALFTREVLPQSFSPPHDLTNMENQENIEGNKQNTDDKDEDLKSKKCSSGCKGIPNNLSLAENNNEEEGLLSIGLGQGKLKVRRTGFKPYKRCPIEARENRMAIGSNQGEEKVAKRIRLEGEALT